MKEVMYDINSPLIVGILSVLLLLAIEVGFRLGLRINHDVNDSIKSQINTIQASLLGVLALLLGFTFSLALQRYDSRSVAVIDEANSIGTTYLRTELLPEPIRIKTKELLFRYIELRASAGLESLDQVAVRNDLLRQSQALHNLLWQQAMLAAAQDPGPVSSGLFIQSLNEMIDAFSTRQAALDRHVPEVVLFLLLGTLVLTGSLVGYASGVAGQRASFATYVLVLLIVLLVFIIIDLDRPRRGLIEIPQDSILELQKQLSTGN
ncbi:MAG TPA: hypothetical protein PKK10_12700 [Woeseiaceae bacterium]|nr:hypothetical protein [Woeseiaceae bacterium]